MGRRLGIKLPLILPAAANIPAAGVTVAIPKTLLARCIIVRAYNGSAGNVTPTVVGGGDSGIGALTSATSLTINPSGAVSVAGNINSPTIWIIWLAITTAPGTLDIPFPSAILTLTGSVDINNAIVDAWVVYDEALKTGELNFLSADKYPVI